MSTDFRALCAELHKALEPHAETLEEERLLDRSAAALRAELAEPADGPAVPEGRGPAAVAEQPRPAPLAEGEVAELARWLRLRNPIDMEGEPDDCTFFMLTRIAELLEERHAAPVPVPVAERLPGPEDCDAEGYCWRWNTIAGSWARQPISRSWYEFETHWLPASDLPLPAPQGGEVGP